jgi:hypothetical protein
MVECSSHDCVRRLVPSAVVLALMGVATPAKAIVQNCDKVDGIHSTSYDQNAVLTITNYLDSSVMIYWINYQGNRVLYRTLASGESYRQETFFTHVWLAASQDGSCASLFVVDRQTDRFAIRADFVPQPSDLERHRAGAEPDTLAPGWRAGE